MWQIILFIILIPSLCYGQLSGSGFSLSGVGAGTVAATAFCATCTGTCVYCEDFEGATDCSDDTADENCRYTYTDTIGAGGTLDFTTAFTTSQCGATATQAMSMTRSGANVIALYSFGDQNPVYFLGYIKITGTGSQSQFFQLQRSDAGSLINISVYDDAGTKKLRMVHTNQASGSVTTLGPNLSSGTWIQVKIYWNANQASGGIDWIVDGTSYTPADTSTKNSNMNIIYTRLAENGTIDYDNMRIQTNAYPTCP